MRLTCSESGMCQSCWKHALWSPCFGDADVNGICVVVLSVLRFIANTVLCVDALLDVLKRVDHLFVLQRARKNVQRWKAQKAAAAAAVHGESNVAEQSMHAEKDVGAENRGAGVDAGADAGVKSGSESEGSGKDGAHMHRSKRRVISDDEDGDDKDMQSRTAAPAAGADDNMSIDAAPAPAPAPTPSDTLLSDVEKEKDADAMLGEEASQDRGDAGEDRVSEDEENEEQLVQRELEASADVLAERELTLAQYVAEFAIPQVRRWCCVPWCCSLLFCDIVCRDSAQSNVARV